MPRLILLAESKNYITDEWKESLIGWIEPDKTSSSTNAEWLCYYYKNKEGYYCNVSAKLVDVMSQELRFQKASRDTASAALQKFMEIIYNNVSELEYNAIIHFGRKYLPTLRQAANMDDVSSSQAHSPKFFL
jgi:hypothetical protein